MSNPRDRQAGFTLIEVIVSLAVLGLMMVVILGGLRLGTRTWRSVDRDAAGSADVAAVQDVLRHAIRDAEPAFASATLGDRTLAFDGGTDALALVSPLPQAIASGVRAQQTFLVEPAGRSRQLVLLWRLDLPASDGGALPENRVVLLDHVARVRFAYFGATEPAQPPAWQRLWSGRARMPELVRVRITRDGVARSRWPDLIASPRATASLSCRYDATAATCTRTR
ncbi:MAG TPA: prepilin-type N-terminal cleavage/methylation domain-containing protein [Acetobacteraceae bacterium]|nr:prepilin-type N-terminal cleavage/methylation domain-containing protein [Acetobacteraceae bacterium]